MISQNKFNDINKYWKNLYDIYSNSLDINLKKDTIDWRLKNIRGLLKYLSLLNIDCNNLTPINVYDYLSSLESYSARTREHRAICVRFFLNFLNDNALINFNGVKILPRIHCNKEEKIITYYTSKEIKKLLSSIDINEINGKLNFSLLTFFIYYGIRLRDVINLKLEDINWNEETICFIQSKTNYITSLPLIDEVKYPMLDYLKNERIKTSSKYIFIRNNGLRINNYYVYYIINKYFKKANIDINNKKHGAHSLRHSLATNLINSNEDIYTISKILGHSNIDDTKIYSKLNYDKLKIVSLEVPTWQI